jgi:subtilisin family serine protease
VVAVIDTGFAKHPYFTQRPYRIKRLAAPDADSPEIDDHRHGTAVLANLVACAPEADVYAIKFDRMDWAVAFALAIPDVRVISLSWVYEQPFALPEWMLVLEFLIVFAVVTRGVTVIAATGFGNMGETCPANMPTVISVGGVSIFVGSRTAWDQTASFQSKAFRGRNAPDLCGVASQIRVPMPPVKKGGRYGWELRSGGTSCAAPQVAGIAALLIQKNRSLTPDDIRRVLVSNGTDIRLGVTFAKDAAVAGPDLATGGGLVNALKAWLCV